MGHQDNEDDFGRNPVPMQSSIRISKRLLLVRQTKIHAGETRTARETGPVGHAGSMEDAEQEMEGRLRVLEMVQKAKENHTHQKPRADRIMFESFQLWMR